MLFHAKPPVAPPPQPTPLKGLRFPCAAAWPCLAANRSNGHGGSDWVENNRNGGDLGAEGLLYTEPRSVTLAEICLTARASEGGGSSMENWRLR